jgi:DNA-binding GntR family transcriptional regulator
MGPLADFGSVAPLPEDRTVEQMLVRELRTSIIEGKLSPGARLPYRQLAEQFSVSVTPIRAALRELAKEGMVEVRPHGGAQVSPLSIEELEELYITRGGLEPWLARLGVERLADGDLELMETLLLQVRQAAHARDREKYLWTAWEYRSVSYRAAKRPRLLEITSILFKRSTRYSFLQIAEDERLDQSLAYTEKFAAACHARDSITAQSVLRQALEWSLSTTLTAYHQRFPSD